MHSAFLGTQSRDLLHPENQSRGLLHPENIQRRASTLGAPMVGGVVIADHPPTRRDPLLQEPESSLGEWRLGSRIAVAFYKGPGPSRIACSLALGQATRTKRILGYSVLIPFTAQGPSLAA